jgi:hypothetical protein
MTTKPTRPAGPSPALTDAEIRRQVRELRRRFGRPRSGLANHRRRLERLEKRFGIVRDRTSPPATGPMARPVTPRSPPPRSSGRPGISRGARLMFVLLCIFGNQGWIPAAPLADVLRRADADFAAHICRWMQELCREGCIALCRIDNIEYLRVVHWHACRTMQ